MTFAVLKSTRAFIPPGASQIVAVKAGSVIEAPDDQIAALTARGLADASNAAVSAAKVAGATFVSLLPVEESGEMVADSGRRNEFFINH